MSPARTPSRYDVTRDELGVLLEGQPRYRVDQVWAGLHEHMGEPDEWTNLPRVLRAELVGTPPGGAERGHRVGEQDGRHGEVLVGARGREPDRERADALPRPCDRLREHAGRMCDGVWFLRHRSGRIHASPQQRGDRRAGACAPRVGHGRSNAACRTWCSWGWANRSPTRPRSGVRSSGSTAISACRRVTSRSARSASCRGSGRSRPARCRSTWPSACTPPTTRSATSSCRSTAATRSTPCSARASTT